MPVHGAHQPVLVLLSILVAFAASYTALDLAGRIRGAEGRVRGAWLVASAIAMGGGIWAMHFVAMLSFQMPGMPVGYDVELTVLSFLVAVGVTAVSFAVMSRYRGSVLILAAAGLFMGLGVVAMHYIGMAAMRMAADLSYDSFWVSVSVLIAIGAATAALWLASRNSHQLEKIAAAAAMGLAISGMHYAAMQGAIFVMRPQPGDMVVAGVGQASLAAAVAGASFLILLLALVASMFDRRFAALAEREADALRQSEVRFRSLYRGTPLPLQSMSEDGRIEQVSNTWLELMGYAREAVVGRPFIHFLNEASAKRFLREDWPALLRDDQLPERDYCAVASDGRFLDVLFAARIERDDRGGIVHVLSGLTDVTGRKQAQRALLQAQKIEALGQLTGGVAHDFNNLLGVIVGNLDLLSKRVPDDPKARRFLASAQEAAQRGASLTQRLLAFARRQDLRPSAVEVPQLIQGMADMLRRTLGPQISVETRFPLSLARVSADAHQLELAILNLAVNARDAMPDGGTLEISAAEQQVGPNEVQGLGAGRYVRIRLADTGEGMDEATLARATEPFFTTKGVGRGTGLGLSMVQGLAEQSGGRLQIDSRVGGGTTVAIFLPVASEEPAHEAETLPQTDAAAPGLMSILVVDDDPLVLANTAAMLEDVGHRVRRAESAESALALLAQAPADLVISDHLMPGMTGLELVRAVRAQSPHQPVLLVSGFAEFEGGEADDLMLLRKPFRQDELLKAVAAATGAPNVVSLFGSRAAPLRG